MLANSCNPGLLRPDMGCMGGVDVSDSSFAGLCSIQTR
jgi:hypothetical protein